MTRVAPLLVPLLFFLMATGCGPSGLDDDELPPLDSDRDGHSHLDDCNDSNPAIYPGAEEQCNGHDDDCDGELSPAEQDRDGDAFTPCQGDCDDADYDVAPGRDEFCNGADDDCDGESDEDAQDAPAWYADTDADNYGDAATEVVSCYRPPGYIEDRTDCDDENRYVHPGGTEICDSADNDCDGVVDEDALDEATWWVDHDGDGYGDPAELFVACAPPAGFVAPDSPVDCNDADPSIHPFAAEVCDAADNDCDELFDDADPDVIIEAHELWYRDLDGDGFGAPDSARPSCDAPDAGWVAHAGDCDDTHAAIYDTAPELCDGVDNNCDDVLNDDGVVFFQGTSGPAEDRTAWFESVPDGGHLLDEPGAYTFCGGEPWQVELVIAADVTLQGEGGSVSRPARPVLSGGDARTVLTIDGLEGRAVAIDFLELRDGLATRPAHDLASSDLFAGGGVHCDGPHVLSVRRSTVSNNTAGTGAGLYSEGGCALLVAHSTISDNVATDAAGGGIAMDGGGDVVLENSDVTMNSAFHAGGGVSATSGVVTLNDALLAGNSVENDVGTYDGGGALWLYDSEAHCSVTEPGLGGILANRSVDESGAVAVITNSSFTSEGCSYGSVETEDDNDPVDVWVREAAEGYAGFGADAWFTCNDDGCVAVE